MTQKKPSRRSSLPPFDKYEYYQKSVQSSDLDVLFFRKTYQRHRDKTPMILREDFCGTFQICCEWAKLGPKYKAIGLDVDEQPIAYGKKNNLVRLSSDQQSRISILKRSVLDKKLPKADLSVAVNFSYMLFKDRELLKQYLRNCYLAMRPKGIHIMDIFGGTDTSAPIEEETEFPEEGYSYFWDQDNFNPVNHHSMFYIHFQRRGEAKRKKVFTYDWRLWTIPEIRDLLKEVGFKETVVYWEGTDKDGGGDGVFRPTEKGETCEGWIAYIVAEK